MLIEQRENEWAHALALQLERRYHHSKRKRKHFCVERGLSVPLTAP